MAGYSGTPLAKKLGIRNNFTIKLVNAPDYYFKLFSDFPNETKMSTDDKTQKDFIHYFATGLEALNKDIISLKKQLQPNGMLWVSWYKKSAKIKTDVSESIIRDLALKNGLVDIKVCAVDEFWSGLKFVIPVKDRDTARNQ
jgi:hypothetical protein